MDDRKEKGMQKSSITIQELAERTGGEMRKEGYAEATIATYEKIWRMFLAYAQRSGTEQYSTEFAYKFLQDRFGSLDGLPCNYTQAEYFRGVCRLDDLFTHGFITSKRPLSKKTYVYPPEYSGIVQSYMARRTAEGLSRSRLLSFALYLERFTAYLHEVDVKSVKHLRNEHIMRFVEDTANTYTVSTVGGTISCLRGFFVYLKEIGETAINLDVFLPSVRNTSEDTIPSAFSGDEVNKLLSCIDRCNSKGKRDYAMLMLAARLGIRASDICGMVFQNIKWEDNKIEFVQQKTGKAISLPLVNDVGDAIIDYLKVRPQFDSKHIFLRMQPPHSRLHSGSLYEITRSYMCRADIHIPPGKKRGPHSLRHSLSSRLLESSIPLPVISEILSHSSSDTTKTYLKIDISQLRECALPVPFLQFVRKGCEAQ